LRIAFAGGRREFPASPMKTRLLLLACALTACASALAQPLPPPPTPQPLSAETRAKIAAMRPLFDGRTLAGWIQMPPAPLTISGSEIGDLPALAKKLREQPDALSRFIAGQFDAAAVTALATYEQTPSDKTARDAAAAIARTLNRLITAGGSLYEPERFAHVPLRERTQALRRQAPAGLGLMRLNRVLLEDAWPQHLAASPEDAWIVKDGAMASTGAGRGVIYTREDYTRFRLIFSLRHVAGKPDHQPCILIFCTRPPAGERGLDALGGIQFQAPNGGHWDYRPGHNNAGAAFTNPVKPKFDNREWCQVELLVDATRGLARMAVATPVGTRGVENLVFHDPAAGKAGPIAWQMHNAGLFDEFKDVRIEIDPAEDRLITVENP
jgi:hypothetical protein